MGSLGPFEILLILLAVLLLFGAKRIPELARGLGKGIREFKDATNDIRQEFDVNRPEPPRQVGPPQHQPQYAPQQQPYAQPQQPYAPPPQADQAPPASAAPLQGEPPPATPTPNA